MARFIARPDQSCWKSVAASAAVSPVKQKLRGATICPHPSSFIPSVRSGREGTAVKPIRWQTVIGTRRVENGDDDHPEAWNRHPVGLNKSGEEGVSRGNGPNYSFGKIRSR